MRTPIRPNPRVLLRLTAAAVATLPLSCASMPAEPDPTIGARRALVDAAGRGPVLVEIHGNAARTDGVEPPFPNLPATFARGVRNLDVAFTTDPGEAATTDPRLVIIVDPPQAVATGDLCRAAADVPVIPQPGRTGLIAAFCEGEAVLGGGSREQVSFAAGERARDRAVWRVANDVFPDDYESTYGINVIPGVDIGIGGSFGF